MAAGGPKPVANMCMRRVAAPAVRSLVTVPAAGGRELLGAVYADASFRLWNVGRGYAVLHEPLRSADAAAEAGVPSRARYAPPPPGEPGRPGKLAVQFDAPPAAAAGAVCCCTLLCQHHTFACGLVFAPERAWVLYLLQQHACNDTPNMLHGAH